MQIGLEVTPDAMIPSFPFLRKEICIRILKEIVLDQLQAVVQKSFVQIHLFAQRTQLARLCISALGETARLRRRSSRPLGRGYGTRLPSRCPDRC